MGPLDDSLPYLPYKAAAPKMTARPNLNLLSSSVWAYSRFVDILVCLDLIEFIPRIGCLELGISRELIAFV